jgi:PAS domain S-box-containing protein
MAERLSIEMELPSALKPGIHIAIRAFPIQGGLGMSFRDVTERHHRLRIEREQAARLQLALTASGLGDWSWDAASDVITFSERGGAIFGLAPGQRMTWRSTTPMIHPDDRDWCIKQVAEAYATGGHYEMEMRIAPGDGSPERWVMARGQVQADPDGRPASMIGVIADITAARAHEAQLRETESRFRIMADCAPAPVWVTAAEGPVEFVNQAFSDYTGKPREALLGDAWVGIMHPDDIAPIVGLRAQARERQTLEAYSFEARFKRYDGEWRWMRATSSPRFDEAGRFLGYVGIAMDLTDIRIAEDRQQLMINELNHRVKNTLATVQSLAEQSSRQSSSKGEFKDKFLARLMALSAAHSRLTQSSWDWTPLSDVVEDQLQLHGAGQRLRAAGPDVLVPPSTALSLSLALHELATNAAKYGALSGAAGEATLGWSIFEHGKVRSVEVVWREAGGPLVEVPAERGFGSRLLEMVGRELGGEARLDFEADGLTWKTRFPLPPR